MRHFKYHMTIMAFLSCFLMFGQAALAFDDNEYTESEKAGFAFYYYAKTDPDFEKWIREYSYYKEAKPSKKNHILYEDKARLSKGLQLFQPENNYISYTTPARIHITKPEDRTKYLEQYKKIPVRLELPRILEIPGSQETYFPFFVGNVWFALIPDNFQNFLTIYMDGDEYYEFLEALGVIPGYNTAAVTIDYTVRATSADTVEPFPIGSNNFWLIMAEVGSVQIFDKDKKNLIWDYEAPWFIPKTKQDLMNLFKQ